MQKQKIVAESRRLERPFHVDLFQIGVTSQRLVLFFGGSGIDEDEYAARARSIIPVFDASLETLQREGESLALVYVTAPFDVPYARFPEFPGAAQQWRNHVFEELLPAVEGELAADPMIPFFLSAYSGGAALAFSGVQYHERCQGAAALGADGLPHDLELPAGWLAPLALYYNSSDRVRAHNESAIRRLEAAGAATCLSERPGAHKLEDYVRNGSFADLLRRFNG